LVTPRRTARTFTLFWLVIERAYWAWLEVDCPVPVAKVACGAIPTLNLFWQVNVLAYLAFNARLSWPVAWIYRGTNTVLNFFRKFAGRADLTGEIVIAFVESVSVPLLAVTSSHVVIPCARTNIDAKLSIKHTLHHNKPFRVKYSTSFQRQAVKNWKKSHVDACGIDLQLGQVRIQRKGCSLDFGDSRGDGECLQIVFCKAALSDARDHASRFESN
jgi:hypothetical protein